jgi:OmpA-OmpF porin, OOP family
MNHRNLNLCNLSSAIRFAIGQLLAVALLCTIASAQSIKIQGVIKARNGDIMIVQTSDAPNLPVLLTDDTEVGQVQGVLKARKKEMSMASLIPGLAIKVEGTYDDQKQLVAKSVSFKGNDLEQAKKIQAGIHETQVQAQQNKAELEKHNAELASQNAALQQHQQQIASNKSAIDAAVARFGELDDYYILDEVTIYFANGKINVDPGYRPKLVALAAKAKGVNGYVIEVKGFASSTGSTVLNQQLSEDRAEQVVNILIQAGHVPATRMLAPGAMGESDQVTKDDTPEGQAQNRRVVVRVLQNKAIAGV